MRITVETIVNAPVPHVCGDNLPLVEASYVNLTERIRFSVLKCSGGDFSALKRVVENAKKDWRDTLMAAGFGDNVADHLKWQPTCD